MLIDPAGTVTWMTSLMALITLAQFWTGALGEDASNLCQHGCPVGLSTCNASSPAQLWRYYPDESFVLISFVWESCTVYRY